MLSGFFNILSNAYLDWILYDFLTIVLIIILLKISIIKNCPPAHFVLIGLSINALLASIIYYDLYVLNNLNEWWFWSFYSIGVNVIDVLMMLSLILNKNFLTIIRCRKTNNSSMTKWE
jgi:ABC-type Fe3+-siderophore transport system permease subunit